MPHRHLFLDLREATRVERLHRRVHQPRRHPHNPILKGEHPYEQLASLYGTVLFDPADRLFKMWYLTGPSRQGFVQVRHRRALGNITLLGYAVSQDGIVWEKPLLGQVDFEGSSDNNLIEVGRTNCEGFAVLLDERDPDPARRFKGFYWEHGGIDTFTEYQDRLIWGKGEGDGLWMSFSPDGVRWSNCPQNPVIPKSSDTTQSLVWDESIQKYVAFGRLGIGGRRVARSESADGVHFTEPELVFAADEWDEEETQFYGMPVNIYEGVYLGMVWVYREGVDSRIDTSLATSRDGRRWERVLDRQTFLSLGEEGSWEDGMARVAQNFIAVGDQIYLYYGGVSGPHTGRKFSSVERKYPPMLGLATLRRDGFASLEAGEEEGFLLTRPLVVEGRELHLNADSQGHIVVELADDQGRPLPGYSSLPIAKDRTDALVRFDRPLEALQGRQVRLRFRLRRASLYSYWFV
jgi:hypothetical protein